MSGPRAGTLAHVMGSAMGARLGMAVLNFGLFWLLSHRFATPVLGGYSLLMNVFYLSAALPLLGLSGPLARRAATQREPAQLAAALANALVFAGPVSLLLAGAIGALGVVAYPAELHTSFWLVGLALLPSAVTLCCECMLVGLERMGDVARVQFVEALLRTVGVLVAVRAGAGLEGVFLIFLALRLATAAVWLLHPGVPGLRQARSLVTAAAQAALWREVPVFLGIVGVAALLSRVDMLVLARLANLHEVGVYAAAARLYDASLMLPTIAALAMMPTLARLYASDRPAFGQLLRTGLRLNLALGLVLALGVAALAQPLIDLLYRSDVAEAAPALRWLMFGAVLMTADQMLSSTMVAAHAQVHDLGALLVAVAVLVAGLLLAVPAHQAQGAAIAVFAALVARVGYRLVWARRVLALAHLGRDLLAIALSGLAAAAAMAAVLQHLGVRGPGAWAALSAGVAVHAAGLQLGGVFDLRGVQPWRGAWWRQLRARLRGEPA